MSTLRLRGNIDFPALLVYSDSRNQIYTIEICESRTEIDR